MQIYENQINDYLHYAIFIFLLKQMLASLIMNKF